MRAKDVNGETKSRKMIWLATTAVVAITGAMLLWFFDSDSRSEDLAQDSSATADRAPVATVDQAATALTPAKRQLARQGAIREISVAFSNGVTVPVRLRDVPFPGAPIRGERARLIDFYDQLAKRARAGEARAAHELSRQLQRCQGAYTDEASLNGAIARLREQRFVTYADGRTSRQMPGDADVESMEETELREPFEFCRGVDGTTLEEAGMWQQMAINADYYWAWQDWARRLHGTAQEFEAWNTLWERGHFSVLQPLQVIHSRGVAGSPPDYIRVYAYNLIELNLMQAALGDSPSPTYRNWVIAVEDSLRHAGSYLTPAETETATALAVELLKNSPNCCIGKWN